MALTVAGIEREARELHPGFRPEWTPGPVLRRFLSRYQRTLVSKVAKVNPDFLDAQHTISLPLGSFPTSPTLPAAHDYRTGKAVRDNGEEEPFYLVMWADRARTRFFPAGTIVGDVLHLVGEESEWTGFASIELGYVPIPADLTAAASTFVLPDSAQPALVSAAADFLAGRLQGRADAPRIDVGRFRADLQHDEREFLREVANRRQANERLVQERF